MTVTSKSSSATKSAGYLAVLGAAAAWGTAGIFIKAIMLASDVSALTLAFWRDGVTAIVLFLGLLMAQPKKLRLRARDLPQLAAMGAGLGAFHVFWNWAVYLNGAAIATIQQSAMPAIVVIAARIFWREPLTWRKIGAVVLTFAGTVLVSGVNALGQLNVSGLGLLVGACLPMAYAAWNLAGKGVSAQYDAFTTLAYAFAFGALMLLPLQFFGAMPSAVPMTSLVWFAGLIGQTVIAFSLYTFGLGRLPASIASILAMTEIVFVSIYAYTLLGERLGLMQIIGAIAVIAGVLILFEKRAPIKSETQ